MPQLVSARTNELKLNRVTVWQVLKRQLNNPLLLILLVATTVSFITGSRFNSLVVAWMMFLSVILGFWNEYRAERTMEDLLKTISFMATVIRNGAKISLPVKEIKTGDHVFLYPGAVVPADMKLTQEKGMEVNESVLSGESAPVRKGHHDPLVYMGTTVVSGEGQGVVTAIGTDTKFGQLSRSVATLHPQTEFQKGLHSFGVLLVRVITLMTILIFIVNGLVGRPWLEAAMFALTVAIGLTPELLPVVVTVSLAHGARRLAKKDIIVKQLVAIEDLGNMEVLCCDKTGTLTEGRLEMVSHQNREGREDHQVLQLALLCNSAVVHHKVFGDAIDTAVWQYAINQHFHLPRNITKVSEMPFDYEHRSMFTVTEKDGKRTFIYKGAPDTVLAACGADKEKLSGYHSQVDQWYRKGYRVIALATKEVSSHERYTYGDAHNLQLAGFILFSDPPKHGVRQVLDRFEKLGVKLKIITGDNEYVTRKICEEVDIPCHKLLTGPEVSALSEQELIDVAWSVDAFARMTPDKKLRVIRALRYGNHTVGYIGDGINDAPALHEADAGISVNTAVDIAKDTASIVLLKKSLGVIVEGIEEGRRTFVNTLKYILMGTSSNFGNMFSMAGASFLLPFLPMTPSQILLTNALYDFSQLSLPTDKVDEEELTVPRKWDLGLIRRYMVIFGPISSLYDFLTFGVMYFIFKARGSLFQTGWFVESLMTEILVIFLIRTHRLPFWKSRPGPVVVIASIGVVIIGLALPFSPLSRFFEMIPLPGLFFVFLILVTLTYLALVELAKKYFLRQTVSLSS